MAAPCRPAGYEDEDEDEFMFGDENYLTHNNSGSSESQSRVTFGLGPVSPARPCGGQLEDFRMAIMQGNVKAVTEALDQGIDVNVNFSSGWSALMYAGNCAKADVFKLLLMRGANPNFHKDMHTVLMATCGSNYQKAEDLTECVRLLIEKGADVNAHDRHHVTPLMYAAREGRMETVQLLLDNGAQIDRQDTRGWTALSWATQREQLGVMKLLLDKGADKNKRHSDNLTAIDLARGKEEVVWLFEGKKGPVDEMGAGDAAVTKAPLSQETADMKYGDLEVFLFGLELGHLHKIFLTNKVDFPMLLTLNEEDLINMGITQVGVRKKVLEGTAAVHKRNWESSSLVPIRIKSQVKCPDAIAIVANVSKHLRYISSSVTYIKDQLKHDADFLRTSQNGADPKQLLLHTKDSMKNLAALQQELTRLHSTLAKELAGADLSPPDQISRLTTKKRKVRYRRLALTVVGASSLAVLVWKRDWITENVNSLVHNLQLRLS